MSAAIPNGSVVRLWTITRGPWAPGDAAGACSWRTIAGPGEPEHRAVVGDDRPHVHCPAEQLDLVEVALRREIHHRGRGQDRRRQPSDHEDHGDRDDDADDNESDAPKGWYGDGQRSAHRGSV